VFSLPQRREKAEFTQRNIKGILFELFLGGKKGKRKKIKIHIVLYIAFVNFVGFVGQENIYHREGRKQRLRRAFLQTAPCKLLTEFYT
jgi:hypothetical protein